MVYIGFTSLRTELRNNETPVYMQIIMKKSALFYTNDHELDALSKYVHDI